MTAYRWLAAAAVLVMGCAAHRPPAAGSEQSVVGSVAPVAVSEGAVCPQTYEFGNYGCVDLTGRVRLPSGAPAVGATVGVPDPVGADGAARGVALGGGFPTVDAAGRYRLRLTRYSPPPTSGAAGGPDTLTVVLRAALPPGPDVPAGTAGPAVFARVLVEFRPVGAAARVYELPDLTIR